MLVKLALVVSIGINILTILVLANQRRKVQSVMTENADALNSLTGDVHNESSVVDSAIVLITGLANRLTAALASATSPEDLTSQIQALRDEINARSEALAHAVAAGTASENDSSNFPAVNPPATTNDTGSGDVSSPPSDSTTSDQSTAGTSSDTSSQSGDATPASSDVGSDVSAPSGDGTADVNPPSDSTAGAGDGSVVPDGGSAVADESTTSDSPPSE